MSRTKRQVVTEPIADDPRFDEWLDDCRNELERRNAAARAAFGVGDYNRWDIVQGAMQLVFSDKGKPEVTADAQCIGSYSYVTNTWKWGWASASVSPRFSNDILKVREYGEAHGFESLVTDVSIACSEDAAWLLAAGALVVLDAEGVYCGATEHGLMFLLLRNLRRL